MIWRRQLVAATAWLLSDCVAPPPAGRPVDTAERSAAPAPAPARDIVVDPAARFWYDPALPLGRPPLESLVNVNGSPRITDRAAYDRFWRELAPQLTRWAADPGIGLNPNYVAALMAKESGFDPRALSDVPANGIAQMTYVADADLLIISRDSPRFHWMADEVRRWPRHPAIHDSLARRERTERLLASGAVDARSEYLFDPWIATRASLFFLRILATVWTEDVWPGEYGSMARDRLAGGRPLAEADLLALVTVSYNQGHPYVADLVKRHGREWTRYLNEESSDYLERIARYTVLFQRAASGR